MSQRRPWQRLTLAWGFAYLSAAALLAWARNGIGWYLILAFLALAACGAAFFVLRRELTHAPLIISALVGLVLGHLGAIPIALRLRSVGSNWEQLQQEHEIEARADLDLRVNLLRARAVQALDSATRISTKSRRELFTQLERLRARTKVDALIIFGDSGELVAWSGDHYGRIPPHIRLGSRAVHFSEGPLYTYMYFVRPRPDSGRVLAGVLVDAALPHRGAASDEQSNLFTGRNAAFLAGPGATGAWSFVDAGDTLFHARLDPPSQAEWRRSVLRMGQRLALVMGFVTVLLLTLAWFRQPGRPASFTALVPYLGSVAVVASAPLGGAFRLETLFSPELFLLPGPGTVSLGTLLALLLTSGAFVASLRTRARYRHNGVFIVLALLFAALLPIGLQVLIGPAEWAVLSGWRAATSSLLRGGPYLWVTFQAALVLLFAIPITFVLMVARWPARVRARGRQRNSMALLSSSVALAGALALVVIALAQTREQVTTYLAVLWAAPVVLAGFGAAAYQRDGRRLVRWLVAGWIAATVALPYMWVGQVNTMLRVAEHDLATLGSRPDPYLRFLLRQFGTEAMTRRERGEDGLQLLYRSWVSSGLAQEAYPSRITLWDSAGQPTVRLPLGDAFSNRALQIGATPSYLQAGMVRVHELGYPEVFLAPETEPISQVLVVPFERGRTLTVEVPPRRTFERTSVVAPLLGSRSSLSTSLELVAARAHTVGRVWRPTNEGWRSASIVHFPDATYHAHLTVRVPNFFVQVARGALVIAADLALLVLLWLIGRVLRAETVMPANGWFGWRASFRSRVTATLFLFFLLPTIVFGWVAYSALAREVQRAARVVAQRAAHGAVLEFPSQGDLRELATHAGAEVLLFFQGELGSASSAEAIELGVFSVLMPPSIFLAIDAGDEEAAVASQLIGEQEFLTAYRRLQPAGTGVMAVPISLQSNETVQRQREMAHIVLFAALVGGIASLLLSLAVGRALTGPIGRLQRAASAVGAGRLNVQLPEDTGDEFGRLYASFNRMVRRLRRARAQELRTARVIAWGEMARQVAHEIKNPLTPIKLAVQHLRRAYGDRRPDFEQVLGESVDQILIEIDRLTEIARAFSRYGAPPESAGPLETVLVSNVVQEALTLYRTGDTRVRYLDDIEYNLPAVFSRAGELKEVLLNLLENARDASSEGGTVIVSAKRDGLAVELCVRDDGAGISREQLARIFDPHFSTRTTGTGLGLPIVRRLVESWGGTVDAESEAGHGTTIRIRLQAVLSEDAT